MLVKEQCRLDTRKYSVSERTVNEINEWNKLSTDCVNAIKTELTNTSKGQIVHR